MFIYEEASDFLEKCFNLIENYLPSPSINTFGEHNVLRYTEKSIDTAIIQKLARYLSSLNASRVLLLNGYTQETGVLFRTLDEIDEDIFFLCIPKIDGKYSQVHNDYLNSFFQEELDNPRNAFLLTQKRPTVSRKKIHATISNFNKETLNLSDSKENMRTLSQIYSGYVHGSSVHIIEMVDINSKKYLLRGMLGTSIHNDFIYNYWDYVYRAIISTMLISKVLGFEQLYIECSKFRKDFEEKTERCGTGDAEVQLKKMKAKH